MELGDIVYYIRNESGKLYIEAGIVEDIYPRVISVDNLVLNRKWTVDGVPAEKMALPTKKRKLPSGWTYDTQLFHMEDVTDYSLLTADLFTDKEKIRKVYDAGLLIGERIYSPPHLTSKIDRDGWCIDRDYTAYAPDRHSAITLEKKLVFEDYDSAAEKKAEVDAEYARIASLTDEEWSIEQIQHTVDRAAMYRMINPKRKQEYVDKIVSYGNAIDIETRVFGANIEWKYEKEKRWKRVVL